MVVSFRFGVIKCLRGWWKGISMGAGGMVDIQPLGDRELGGSEGWDLGIGLGSVTDGCERAYGRVCCIYTEAGIIIVT